MREQDSERVFMGSESRNDRGECLQLRTINLQTFQEDKAASRAGCRVLEGDLGSSLSQ
jgi:hypothetical protein